MTVGLGENFTIMDDDDESKIIEFGIAQESRLSFKSKTLGTVVPFRRNEYLVIGQKGLTRFEANLVKETYPYKLTALYRDTERKLFIGITEHTPEFIILFESNLNLHIKTGVKIDDYCVFNIIFSKKSSTIITAGSHIKTWKFTYIPSTCRVVFELPTIIIEPLDTIMYNINWGILNPPMFDYDKEELLINDYKGNIISYNLKGNKNGIAINYGCTDVESCFAYNSDTKQLISNNILQGAVIWNRNGSNSDQTFLGSSLTKFIQFINYEFVILLDARNVITIFDIITRDFFAVYQVNYEVSRIFYIDEPIPRLLICAKTDVIILRVTLPWRYWYTTGSRSIMMSRINKIDEAARVFVELSNAQIRLLSPINSRILTGITLKTLSSPITFFYDRGIPDLPKVHRDQILIPLVNGQMQIFSTGTNPCEEIDCLDFKILCICQCIYKGKYAFCYGTAMGNLMFYDYITMKSIGRIVAYPAPVLGVYYHEDSDSLLIAIEDRVLRMDLSSEHVTGFIRLKYSKLNLYFDGILFFAQDNGKIRSVCVAPEDPYKMTELKYMNNKKAEQKAKEVANKDTYSIQNSTNTNMTSRTNLNMVSKNSVSSKLAINEKEEENEKEKEKEKEESETNIKKKLDIPFKFISHHSNGMTMHEGQITGLSLGSVFFVSCSVDKTLRVWNRDFTQRCLIIFPLPLYSCCALNGKRDILVSTEKEIMIIKGSIVFDDQMDEEDLSIDNFDKKQDKLYNETMSFFEEEEEVKEDFFDNRAKVEKSKHNRRRFRFADAIRMAEEENQRRIKAYLEHKDDPEYRKRLDRILEEAKKNLKPPEEEKVEEKEEKRVEEDEYEYEEYEVEDDVKENVEIKLEEPDEAEKVNTPVEETPESKEEDEKHKKAVLSQFFGGANKKTTKPKTSSTRPAKQIDVTKYLNNNTNHRNDEVNNNDDDEETTKKKKAKKKDYDDAEENKSTKKKASKKKQKQSHLSNPKQSHFSSQKQSHLSSPKQNPTTTSSSPTKLYTKATNTESPSAANSEYTGSISQPERNPPITPPAGQPGFGPGFSKLTKQRRYPTPLKESKKVATANKRPSSSITERKTQKRSKTPEPRMPIVDRIPNPPPLNIIFDIDMIARMVESGDDRYAPILNYLTRHGLVREGNTWDVKMSFPKNLPTSSSSKPKSPRRKRNNRSIMSPNPNITNYPVSDNNDDSNSRFMRQFIPPPIGQPDFDDEVGMKLFKSRVDELVSTKRLISPSNDKNRRNDGKIPSFQPKIVPTNQTQLDVTMYSNSIIKGNEKGNSKQNTRKESPISIDEQIAARRAALKRQQEMRKQYLLEQEEKRKKQEELEKQQYVVHYRSSPPVIPPVPIGNISTSNPSPPSSSINGGFGLDGQFEASDSVGVQNLIPEEGGMIKNSQSAREVSRPRVQFTNRQPLSARNRDRVSPRKQRNTISSSDNEYDYNRPGFPSAPSTPRSNEEPRFVEPIMPVYLRASGEIFICDKKISPFACKRYRLVIDENGPKKLWSKISPQPPNAQSNQPLSSALIATQQQTSLIDQVNKSPRTVKKPLSQKAARHV